MSEFHHVLSNTYGDARTRLVDRAVAPHEAELLRQWRAEGAATQVAELGVVAGSVEAIPVQRQAEDANLGQTMANGVVAVESRP